jgi:2-haloacid dehalogenase
MDFSPFRILTFDCYGTLIDWESGIVGAMRPILAAHGKQLDDAEILRLYAELESKAERGEYRRYRSILADVVAGFGDRLGFTPTDAERASLAESIARWQPFPDTVAALQRLYSRFALAVISNIDDDLFAHTAPLLEVPLFDVITAQQAGSYKPSRNNFELALRRLAIPKEKILHVARSLYHDHAPAKAMGFTTVWVNRRKGQPDGAPPASARFDLEVPDLAALAELALPGTSGAAR